MQIREQGKKVQLIRGVYDPTPGVKRFIQTVVHTFNRPEVVFSDAERFVFTKTKPEDYLNAEQYADLSVDEKVKLYAWLINKVEKQEYDARCRAVVQADKLLTDLAAAIPSAHVSETAAADIWDAMAKVAKALKKAGHPKGADRPWHDPKAKAQALAKAEADPRQADLLHTDVGDDLTDGE